MEGRTLSVCVLIRRISDTEHLEKNEAEETKKDEEKKVIDKDEKGSRPVISFLLLCRGIVVIFG